MLRLSERIDLTGLHQHEQCILMQGAGFLTIVRITGAYFPELPKVRGKVIVGLFHKLKTSVWPPWFCLKVKLVNNSSVNPFSLL